VPGVRTLLTLDYEVFFGPRTGTVARCLIEPTEALRRVAERRGAKLVFFVDAGFLLRLRSEQRRSPYLRAEHAAVCRQVEALARAGHEIQLHVHPHWEDTRWSEDGWRTDVSRYALQSFAPGEIREIVARYAAALRELAGPRAAYAYRAGGWVIQPFAPLREALLAAGVTIDSTVFRGGRRSGPVQPFDFRAAPAKSRWRFDADPLREDPQGRFLEVPIASRRLWPSFYWRFAWAKKAGGARHRAFGDGRPLALERGELAAKLLAPSASVVSLDGYKASFLAEAAAEYRARGMEDFVVIGHPKALTPYALERLERFLAGEGGPKPEVSTYAPLRVHRPAAAAAAGAAA
jgi:hypothetical protein